MRLPLAITLALLIAYLGELGADPPKFYSVAIDEVTQYPLSFESTDLYVSGIYNISASLKDPNLLFPIVDEFSLPLAVEQTATSSPENLSNDNILPPNLTLGTCSEDLPPNAIAQADQTQSSGTEITNNNGNQASTNPNDDAWYACLNGDKGLLESRGFVGSSGFIISSAVFNGVGFGEGGFFASSSGGGGGTAGSSSSGSSGAGSNPPGGSVSPGNPTPPTVPVPEPATVLILGGAALLGSYLKSNRIDPEKS